MKLKPFTFRLIAIGILSCSGLGQQAHAKEILPGVTEQPAAYFYTGKPYDADLGNYTFNARNYNPEVNRWTSVDPSGFPDGPNNQLYVNNLTTVALDVAGFNLYMITNTSAVLGGGHSALISGSGSSYLLQSYGSGSSGSGSSSGSSNGPTSQSFSSLSQAMTSAYGSGYSVVNQWTTTAAEDASAQQAFNANANSQNYNLSTHNCQDAVNAALDAAGANHNPTNNPTQAATINQRYADDHSDISKYE